MERKTQKFHSYMHRGMHRTLLQEYNSMANIHVNHMVPSIQSG